MRNHEHEYFGVMKNEDNSYGDKFHKIHTVKDHNKKEKYVKKYQNLRPEDLTNDDDEDYDYDDGYVPMEE